MVTVRKKYLLSFSAILPLLLADSVWNDDAKAQGLATCSDAYVQLPEGCEQVNQTTVVNMPAGESTEFDRGRVENDAGFVLAIDGKPINADPRIEDRIRKTDLALAKADVKVQFDGLGAKPRLNLELETPSRAYAPGDNVTFQSRLNYPHFITRAEVLIIDRRAAGGPKIVARVPIQPNGTASIVLPNGRDLVAVHQVYDKYGRYDQTVPLRLDRPDNRGLQSAVEGGLDATARRRIPVTGGAVTVSSTNVAPGARVHTLGETITPNEDGHFVIQRILPAGDHEVEVIINGGNAQQFTREVEIPHNDVFFTALADLTFGAERSGDTTQTFTRGRLAFYVKGKNHRGFTFTASADTGEGEIDEVFRDFDRKDPRSVLDRLVATEGYTVFGDDSTSIDDTPTSGKIYLKIERDGNFLSWGDFQNRIEGNTYVRNERELYGAQAHWASQRQTAKGEPRVKLQFYASQPDTLPGRDIFRGTGGSVYFLQRQDLNVGSESLSIEYRDPDTGRVIERHVLQGGIDYTINYIQGTIVLKKPLSGSAASGLITPGASAQTQTNLVVQYEFTPTTGDVDGFSFGGRAEVWATGQLRMGVSGMSESTATADQRVYGADILYQFGTASSARLDYAHTRGPGFGNSFSSDGGLIVDNQDIASGDGEAINAEIIADFGDIGIGSNGTLRAYYERRSEGFSILDHQVTAATGDEELWGLSIEGRPNEKLLWALSYDDYSNEAGDFKREIGAELEVKTSNRFKTTFALDHLERPAGGRTDGAVRFSVTPNQHLEYYVFGQATLSNDGLADNNRYGVGGRLEFAKGWTGEAEISEGTEGIGGRFMLTHERDANNSTYFGYERDAAYELSDSGTHQGRFLSGGRRQVGENISIFAENTYDTFGVRNTLTSAYGVTYTPSQHLSFDVAAEVGRVQDNKNGNFVRNALSFGVNYQNEALTAQGKIEYRRERGAQSGTLRDADTFLINTSARYNISQEQRLLFSLKAADTKTNQSSILDGTLIDASIGYAYRPVDNDHLNLLFKYRFLYDMYGQRVDGVEGTGPRQKSHVFSLDATYDLNEHWTIGGKVGARLAETSPDATSSFTRNDAVLLVLQGQYHVTHNWDLLVEGRQMRQVQSGSDDFSVLAAVYRHVGNNVKVGLGYNFGSVSDDLTDLSGNSSGLFLNVIAKF